MTNNSRFPFQGFPTFDLESILQSLTPLMSAMATTARQIRSLLGSYRSWFDLMAEMEAALPAFAGEMRNQETYDELVQPYRRPIPEGHEAMHNWDHNAPEWVYRLVQVVLPLCWRFRNRPGRTARPDDENVKLFVRSILAWCEAGNPEERSAAAQSVLRLVDRDLSNTARLDLLMTFLRAEGWTAPF